MKPILHQELAYFWNPYNATEARTLTFATSPSTSNTPPSREFGQTESYFVHEDLHPSEIPALWRIPLAELPTGAAGVWVGYDHREFSFIRDPRRPCTSHKMVTFHPTRPCDLPIWNLAHSRCVDRLTPNDYPVARAGDADEEYYGMMMGGLPNTPEKKLAALSILSMLSNESIGLVGVHRFSDGFIQTHTGGHLAFFYVQGAAAAANVMKWSKCLLVCEDEIVVVLNSQGEPEQAEKILRTIVPTHADGTPFRKMGHPCPIEFKANAPERRQPAVAQAKSVAVPAQAPRRPMAPAPVQFAPRQSGQRKGKQ